MKHRYCITVILYCITVLYMIVVTVLNVNYYYYYYYYYHYYKINANPKQLFGPCEVCYMSDFYIVKTWLKNSFLDFRRHCSDLEIGDSTV